MKKINYKLLAGTIMGVALALFCTIQASAHTDYYRDGTFSLSDTSISLSVGHSETIYIDEDNDTYNRGYGDYYLSGNLSSGVVVATLNGRSLEIYGQLPGSATVTVCSYSNRCDDVYVRVNGSSYHDYYGNSNYNYYQGNTISLSSTNASLSIGSSVAITVYGNNNGYNGYNYYSTAFSASTNNASVATTSVYGNTVTIYGINPGNTSVNVCSSGTCRTVSVYVTGPQYYNPTPYYPSTYSSNYLYYPSYPYTQNNGGYWSQIDNSWHQY